MYVCMYATYVSDYNVAEISLSSHAVMNLLNEVCKC